MGVRTLDVLVKLKHPPAIPVTCRSKSCHAWGSADQTKREHRNSGEDTLANQDWSGARRQGVPEEKEGKSPWRLYVHVLKDQWNGQDLHLLYTVSGHQGSPSLEPDRRQAREAQLR